MSCSLSPCSVRQLSRKYMQKNTPSFRQLPSPPFLHQSLYLSWSLCVSTVLMIHVLIPLCQGARAASITLCPCFLLASPALTLHPHLHQKKELFVVSNPNAFSIFKSTLKQLFFAAQITLFCTLPTLSSSFSISLHSINHLLLLFSDNIYRWNCTDTYLQIRTQALS